MTCVKSICIKTVVVKRNFAKNYNFAISENYEIKSKDSPGAKFYWILMIRRCRLIGAGVGGLGCEFELIGLLGA